MALFKQQFPLPTVSPSASASGTVRWEQGKDSRTPEAGEEGGGVSMTLVKLLKWTRDVLDAKAQADFVARSVSV
jgi:hypothetical protein